MSITQTVNVKYATQNSVPAIFTHIPFAITTFYQKKRHTLDKVIYRQQQHLMRTIEIRQTCRRN